MDRSSFQIRSGLESCHCRHSCSLQPFREAFTNRQVEVALSKPPAERRSAFFWGATAEAPVITSEIAGAYKQIDGQK